MSNDRSDDILIKFNISEADIVQHTYSLDVGRGSNMGDPVLADIVFFSADYC